MLMARQPTLVQLTDELLARLDERAGQERISRSELIRKAIEEHLATGEAAAIDRAIVEGYTRIPQPESDPWADASAVESIQDEPW
jgi:metal-responsive CopG/Arc/MetJ family transcriptional regulator